MLVTAYDDLDSPHRMRSDAATVPTRTPRLGSVRGAGVRFEEFPRDLPKPVVDIDEAAARLAAGFDRS